MAVMIEGNTFLKANPQHLSDYVSEQDVQTSFLEEIEASLGTGIAAKRISDIKATLAPMFLSLPKNQHGNLESTTVRYAMHRVLIQRHGWSVKGLDHAGAGWNSSSHTGMLKDQVPSYILNLFEQRLNGRGLGLQELAVFAATLEHMIHNEAIGRLGSALDIHGLFPTSLFTEADADKVLDTYMMSFILGEHLGNMSLSMVTQLTKKMPEMYLPWLDTQAFIREVRQKTTSSLGKVSEAGLDFATLVRVAETVSEQFGKFQNADCKVLKTTLMNIEDRGSGRVRLSEFYKPALGGGADSWQFQESSGYLRELGALDESSKDEPRVMIPNYLTAQANCIASSDYYSVCCINECEDLLMHLEQEIVAPEAKPAQILELIAALPSSSVSAPRALSATLHSRLGDIAAEHGGLVQLHGRLFAQWMHHAYPRECPYPHVAGTTSQASATDWGEEATASQEELKQFVSASETRKIQEVDDVHDLMMWSHEEELLVVRAAPVAVASTGSGAFLSGVRSVVFFAAIMAMAVHLVRTMGIAKDAKGGGSEKFMV